MCSAIPGASRSSARLAGLRASARACGSERWRALRQRVGDGARRRRWSGRGAAGGGSRLGRRLGRGGGRACGGRLDEGKDVLLGHPAAGAGAGNAVRVDAVLGRDARDDRRDERTAGLGRLARGGRLGCRSSGSGSCGGAAVSGVSAGLGRPASAGRCGRSAAAGCVVGAAGSAGASTAVAPSGAITASTVPTSTVSPSATRILRRRPRRGSGPRCRPCRWRSRAAARRAAIASPSCFSHFVIVPSETETPIWGITTSICGSCRHVSSSSLVRSQFPEPRRDVVDLREKAFSSGGEKGTGVSGAAIRFTGASRSSNASSAIVAAISPPNPPVRVSSCRTSTFEICAHSRAQLPCPTGRACAGRAPRPRRPRPRAAWLPRRPCRPSRPR